MGDEGEAGQSFLVMGDEGRDGCEVREGDKIIPAVKYEYLDHPADVQLHSWGGDMSEAFEQIIMAMFAYMTDIDTVEMNMYHEIEVEGHDLENLLYQFMSEWLFYFSTEPFFIPRVCSLQLELFLTPFLTWNFR